MHLVGFIVRMLGGFQSPSRYSEEQKNICIRFTVMLYRKTHCMCCFPKVSDRLRDLPRLPLNAYRGFCPGVERPERGEINHSPPATTQFKNEWIYTAYIFT
jgi:hypothetical protein